jgi:adenylate kinase family enzyme
MRAYREQTAPVIEWYRARAREGALRGQSAARVVLVDAIGAVDDVSARVLTALGK